MRVLRVGLAFVASLLIVGSATLLRRTDARRTEIYERNQELMRRWKSFERQRDSLREKCRSNLQSAVERCAACVDPSKHGAPPTKEVVGAALVKPWLGAPPGLFNPVCREGEIPLETLALAPDLLRLDQIERDLEILAQRETNLERQFALPRLLAEKKCGQRLHGSCPRMAPPDLDSPLCFERLECRVDWWIAATGELIATASVFEDPDVAGARSLQEARRYGAFPLRTGEDAAPVPADGEIALDTVMSRALEPLARSGAADRYPP